MSDPLPLVNPFSVFTPEGLDAQRVVDIFSKAMPGLDSLSAPGHAFVFGTRGSGKSILLRYLEPDCQRIVTGKEIDDQPHFALYVSFRETEAKVTELARFENQHGQVFFNEHLLILAICARFTTRLIKNKLLPEAALHPSAKPYFNEMCELLSIEPPDVSAFTVIEAMEFLNARLKRAYREALQYVKRHSFRSDIIDYTGGLYGFEDFLLLYVDFTRSSLGLEETTHLFLFLDDADNLTDTQTRVVNSWIARRLSAQCSIKVAAQLTAYKTRLTTYGTRIEAPHDYQEINLSDISTKAGEANYWQRISHIISQRLRSSGADIWPDKYFPEDHTQKIRIEREADNLRVRWFDGTGRGYRARDDIQRYARPEYIRSLGGNRKSRSKYSYSGFDQLIHISSGVPRFFLEAAAGMYDLAMAAAPTGRKQVDFIPPDIQNTVVRDLASQQFIWDLRDLAKDVEKLDGTPQRAVRLYNLINGLGSLFEAALIDERASERKYFSFAFSDKPSDEVERVLELGVRYGYFFKGIIGRKEGIGRTPLYVLSRRLAPLFNLDPMGFAAYKFMTDAAVKELMDDPEGARKALRRGRQPSAGRNQTRLPFSEGDD